VKFGTKGVQVIQSRIYGFRENLHVDDRNTLRTQIKLRLRLYRDTEIIF
jgi:hypothetical protein